MPQGPYPAPLLYALYLNDVVKIFKYAKLSIYADYMLIYAVINYEVNRNTLQCDLNALYAWRVMWALRINFNICKITHLGKNNLD